MIYEPSCEEERYYLENYDPNKYPKPSVTVDFIVNVAGVGVLFIKRKNYPYKGRWALPGGFLDVGRENTLQAALRELKEETSLDVPESMVKLEGVYSDPDRDPRDHVVSIVYSIELDHTYVNKVKPADDAADAKFIHLNSGPVSSDPKYCKEPPLAFDHDKIICDYINKKYKNKINIKINNTIEKSNRKSNLDILFKNERPLDN